MDNNFYVLMNKIEKELYKIRIIVSVKKVRKIYPERIREQIIDKTESAREEEVH